MEGFVRSSSAPVTFNNAKSEIGSHFMHFALIILPDANNSQWVWVVSKSFSSSAMQCAHVSKRPDGDMQIAVPACSWAKIRVDARAFSCFLEVAGGSFWRRDCLWRRRVWALRVRRVMRLGIGVGYGIVEVLGGVGGVISPF